MSFSWSNFENNAETSSIRGALNQLGLNISDMIKIYQNFDVSSLSFTDDSAYSSYGFTKRLDIPFDDITVNDVPIVIFKTKDALSGDYGVVESANRYLYIFRRESAGNLLTNIPFIGILKSDLITFYVDNTAFPFYAKENMTWKEWCESGYNIEQFECGQEYVFTPAGADYVAYNGEKVKVTDIILNGVVYELINT